MKDILGEYGKSVGMLLVAGILLVFLMTDFISDMENRFTVEEKAPAGNVTEEMSYLAKEGYKPYFIGIKNITIAKGFQSVYGAGGFRKEDALEGVQAYEYRYLNGKLTIEEIPQEKIKVFPFDERSDALQKSGRSSIEVNGTGRYTLRYVVEGNSGLKTEKTSIVLVDFPKDNGKKEPEREDYEDSD